MRVVHEDVQIATNIPEEIRDAIRDTPLADNKTELLALAKLDTEAQAEAIDLIKKGKAKNVRDATKKAAKAEATLEFHSETQIVLDYR